MPDNVCLKLDTLARIVLDIFLKCFLKVINSIYRLFLNKCNAKQCTVLLLGGLFLLQCNANQDGRDTEAGSRSSSILVMLLGLGLGCGYLSPILTAIGTASLEAMIEL